MKSAEIINDVCAHLNITKADLAKQMGLFPSSFYRKVSNENLTFEELQKCLQNVGVSLDIEVSYTDGDLFTSQTSHDQIYERMTILEKELETTTKVSDFHKKTLKELRTELNNAVGYVELSKRHKSQAESYLDKLKMVHTSMERTIAYSLGEAFDEQNYEVTPEKTKLLEGQRVLLVEDNELNREIIREMLLDRKILVDEAEDGSKAVTMVMDQPAGYYQFILMDIEMPGQNGYDATMRIRKLSNRIRANIPIIALTVNATEEDREKAYIVGMDDFLVKPVNTVRLLGCLSKYV